MKRFWKYVTGVVPAYGLFPLVFSFVFNCLVYSGSRAIAGGWYHHNIESSLDLRLPFVPQFLIVYFGCYIFWAVNYILAARQEKEQIYRFFTADLISRCVCLIIFLAYPTTNTRPVIEGSGFWDLLAGWLYSIDAADNLFPSIHCLVSWFCFLGIKDQKRIPAWYKRSIFCAGSSGFSVHPFYQAACSGGCGRWRDPGTDMFYAGTENGDLAYL